MRDKISRTIKSLMFEKRWTKTVLASEAGVNRNTLDEVLNLNTHNYNTLLKILSALNISEESFYSRCLGYDKELITEIQKVNLDVDKVFDFIQNNIDTSVNGAQTLEWSEPCNGIIDIEIILDINFTNKCINSVDVNPHCEITGSVIDIDNSFLIDIIRLIDQFIN